MVAMVNASSILSFWMCVCVTVVWRISGAGSVAFMSAQDVKEIKAMIANIDAKLELSSNRQFQQFDNKIHQLKEKLDVVGSDIQTLKNSVRGCLTSKDDMDTLNARMQVLTDSMLDVHVRLDNISNVQTKLDNIAEQMNDLKQEKHSVMSSKTMENTQRYILDSFEAMSKKIDRIESATRESFSSNSCLNSNVSTATNGTVGPSDLVRPASHHQNPIPNTVNDILEEILSASMDSEDITPVHTPVSAMLRLNAGNSINGNQNKGHMSELLRRIWKKFMKPVTNVWKRFASLEEMCHKVLNVCENGVTGLHKLEVMIQKSLEDKQINGDHLCDDLNKNLGVMSSRMDVLFNNLEQRVFYHISLSEKLFDRVAVAVDSKSTSVDRAEAADDDPVHTSPAVYASDCSEFQKRGFTASGIYKIYLNREEMIVYCDLVSKGGGWTVIQRRGVFSGQLPQNFNQDWKSYKMGFGELKGEFWLGNENIHRLTDANDMVLLVQLKDFDGNRAYAEYELFSVESEEENYRLHVGDYKGNATDSLKAHHQKPFSTFDRINDEVDPCCSCALTFEGGWWFYACFESHLNGPYFSDPLNNGYFRGIIWEHWKGDYSLQASEMKIRPRNFSPRVNTGPRFEDYTDEVDDP